MNAFVEGARQLVICMVLMTLLENLLKDSEYRSYVRLFLGLLIILLVMKPCLSLFSIDFDGALGWREQFFDLGDDSELLLSTDQKRKEALEEEYEQIVIQRLENLLYSMDGRLAEASVSWKEETLEIERLMVRASWTPDDAGAKAGDLDGKSAGESGGESKAGQGSKKVEASGSNTETETETGKTKVREVPKIEKLEKFTQKKNKSKEEGTGSSAGEKGRREELLRKICEDMGLTEGQVELYVE